MLNPMNDETVPSFEECLDTIRVAVALGQQVDAIAGMTLYSACRGEGNYDVMGVYSTEEGAWEACCEDLAQARDKYGDYPISPAEKTRRSADGTFRTKYKELYQLVMAKTRMDLTYTVRTKVIVSGPSARPF